MESIVRVCVLARSLFNLSNHVVRAVDVHFRFQRYWTENTLREVRGQLNVLWVSSGGLVANICTAPGVSFCVQIYLLMQLQLGNTRVSSAMHVLGYSVFAPVSALRNAAMRLRRHSRLAARWSEGQGQPRSTWQSKMLGTTGGGLCSLADAIYSVCLWLSTMIPRPRHALWFIFRSGILFGHRC